MLASLKACREILVTHARPKNLKLTPGLQRLSLLQFWIENSFSNFFAV